jgi:DNA polymerase bacteriophage-type
MKRPRVYFDFETQSEISVKDVGPYKYSVHPSTRAICLYFNSSLDDCEKIYGLKYDKINEPFETLPPTVQAWFIEKIKAKFYFSAHNAGFEYAVYNNILIKRLGWPVIPDDQWHCTAAKAASAALPRKLEGCSYALNLPVKKDMEGHRAMLAISGPRRPSIANPDLFWTPETAPEKYRATYSYCRNDVLVERLIDEALPDLTPTEERIWQLDQKVNWRGIQVDGVSVHRINKMINLEQDRLTCELRLITNDSSITPASLAKIKNFCNDRGMIISDLTKPTVDNYLSDENLEPNVRRVLEIRKTASMSSLKKYPAFIDRMGDDNRLRDLTMYHAASTGRAGGMGVQPHNFPRGTIKDTDLAIKMINECGLEELKVLYGDNLAPLFSSVLRGMFTASPGNILEVADYSAIETRVLWWLARHQEGLNIFYEGRDPYVEMAMELTGKKEPGLITFDERQLGKAIILGCGYGLGYKKFITTAFTMYKVSVTEDEAKHAINTYRTVHSAVKDLWSNYQQAMTQAIESPGKSFKINYCRFFIDKSFLKIELPSGRCLSYYRPGVRWGKTDWGDTRKEISYWGEDSQTKQWRRERTYGGKIVENVTQAVARDIMEYGKRNVEDSGRAMLLTVHDEIMAETKGPGNIKEFEKLICTLPPWAKGCPIKASGYVNFRYKKG